VARELGGVGVKVGEGPTAATIRTHDPASMRAWLAREAAANSFSPVGSR